MGSARHELSEITAAILCGGLGTRLASVLPDSPKALAMVAGQPFLHHLLDQIESAGVRRCVLLTGHHGDQIEAAVAARTGALEVHCSRETHPLDTGGALRFALDAFTPGPVLVMNGDSWCAVDLHAVYEFHLHHPAHATLVASRVEDASRYGSLNIAAGGRILSFSEKTESSGSALASAGIYLLHRGLIERIPPATRVSLERELFPRWATRVGVYACETPAPFLDIGTPESLAIADEFLFTQSRRLADLAAEALHHLEACRQGQGGSA